MATYNGTTLFLILFSFVIINSVNADGIVAIKPIGEPQDSQDISVAGFDPNNQEIKSRTSDVDLSGLMSVRIPTAVEAQFMAGGPVAMFEYVPTYGSDTGIEGEGWYGVSPSGTTMNMVYDHSTGIMSG